MKDNVKYTAKCKLYSETDKEFKFNVFLNETGVIAFSHGLIVLEVTYDRITNKHSISIYHCEDNSLLVSSEVVGTVGPAIDYYIKYLLAGNRGVTETYRNYIDDMEEYFIAWVNTRIESVNANDTVVDMIN